MRPCLCKIRHISMELRINTLATQNIQTIPKGDSMKSVQIQKEKVKPVIWVMGTLCGQSAIVKRLTDVGLVEDNVTFQSIMSKATPFGKIQRYLYTLDAQQLAAARNLKRVDAMWRQLQEQKIALVNVPFIGNLFQVARFKLRPVDTVIHFERDTLKYYKQGWALFEKSGTFKNINAYFLYCQQIEQMTSEWVLNCGADVLTVNGDKYLSASEIVYREAINAALEGVVGLHRQFN